MKKQLFQGSRNQPKADKFRNVYPWKPVKASSKNSGRLQPFLAWCGPSPILSPSSISRMLVYQGKIWLWKQAAWHSERESLIWGKGQNPTSFSAKSGKLCRKRMKKIQSICFASLELQTQLEWAIEHSEIELGDYGSERAKQVLDMLSTSP